MSQKTYDAEDLKHVAEMMTEVFDDKIKYLVEAVHDVQEKTARIPVIEEKVDRLEQRMQTVEAVVTATHHDMHDLDRRVTRLETKLA